VLTVAATATPPGVLPISATAAVILAALAVTVGYLIGCWIYPFTPCRRCHGTGYRPGWLTRHERTCRTCQGEGRRLRFGRWAVNRLRELRQGAHPTGTRRFPYGPVPLRTPERIRPPRKPPTRKPPTRTAPTRQAATRQSAGRTPTDRA
jgi:hypothetical protein